MHARRDGWKGFNSTLAQIRPFVDVLWFARKGSREQIFLEMTDLKVGAVKQNVQSPYGPSLDTDTFNSIGLNDPRFKDDFLMDKRSHRYSGVLSPIDLIMHVYIVPEPGNPVLKRCTILLSLTRTCFHPAHILTPKWAYCHYRCKALLKHIAIASCQVLIFMDEWTSCHMTTLQLPEIRTRDPSATRPMLN